MTVTHGSRSVRSSFVLGAWTWAAAALAFVVLAVLAAFYDRFPADEAVSGAIQDVRVPAFGGFLDFVNALGDAWAYVGITLAVAAAFAVARAGTESVLVLLTFAPRALNSPLKDWIARPRPSAELVDVSHNASGFAYPSGHTVGTAALFGLLFFLLPVLVPWRSVRWVLQAGCVLMVVAAGPARVYVGVHWPSDVLAGYLLALLFLLPVLLAYRALRGGESDRRLTRHARLTETADTREETL